VIKKVGKVKIGRKIKEYTYPRLRLPSNLSNWINKKALFTLQALMAKKVYYFKSG